MLLDHCSCLSWLSVLSILSVNVGVLWPNGWMDKDETWLAGRPRPQPHCVRWGPSSPHRKGHSSSHFRNYGHMLCLRLYNCLCPYNPCLLWPNGGMDQDAIWWEGRPWSRPHCVTWGPSSPLPAKGAQQPQFSAHVYCSQTAGWIKMKLGMEVGLIPGHIVLDGYPAPSSKGAQLPQFSAHVCCGLIYC